MCWRFFIPGEFVSNFSSRPKECRVLCIFIAKNYLWPERPVSQGRRRAMGSMSLYVSGSVKPANERQHYTECTRRIGGESSWDTTILFQAPSEVYRARVTAASSPHSGDWLHAPAIVSIGFKLSDEATRIAVAHRLECRACESQSCLRVCVKTVDSTYEDCTRLARSGLPQKCSQATVTQSDELHHLLEEPSSLLSKNQKRWQTPRRSDFNTRAKGKSMAWDVTSQFRTPLGY